MKFGAWTNQGFVDSANKGLEIKRITEKIDRNVRLIQIKIKNIGDNDIFINSFLVGEFELEQGKAEKVLINGWGQSSFTGYRNINDFSRKPRFFFKRDFNPCSFRKEYGYLEKSLISEWYCQLVYKDKALVVGAITTERQFSQIFIQKQPTKIRVRITCQADGLPIKPGQEMVSEKIAIIWGPKEESLETFGNYLKSYGQIAFHNPPPVGINCAYYENADFVDEKYVRRQLASLNRIKKTIRPDYLMIDDGYCQWGDWLLSQKQFPSGMKKMVAEVKREGLKAGIWLSPLVASPNSKLFRDNPEWFLKDGKSGKFFDSRLTSPIDLLPNRKIRVLDITKIEVQIYLKKLFSRLMGDGFEMFKLDFLYPICFSNNYEKKMTRAEALRLAIKTIRRAVGENVCLTTGISQLSPLVGLIDSVRVGIDSTNPFVYKIPIVRYFINRRMLSDNLRNCRYRQFLNGKVWINDADCVVWSKKSGLPRTIIKEHWDYLRSYGGARWLGSDISNGLGPILT